MISSDDFERAAAKMIEAEEMALMPQWPEAMAPEARHGLLGEWLERVEPHTEADPAALLLQALVAVGNLIGHGPHFRAEGDRHHAVLFTAIVGQTAKGRKGTSEGRVRQLARDVDEQWASNRIKSGLSTGEGLTFEVRDAQIEGKNPDAGEPDKRLLVIEPELARVLSVSERQGNTLSATVRQVWDCPKLLAPMTKTNRCAATDPHISVIGHITRDELRRLLPDTARSNGFANRFLWVAVRRSKVLPEGGVDIAVGDIAARIAHAVKLARLRGEIRRDEGAKTVWARVYPELSEGKPGLLGSVTSRAESQVMRLALVYALLDGCDSIKQQHLAAALAVWDYCERSARFIFGDSLGDPTADMILKALRRNPRGMTRTEIGACFDRNKSSSEVGRALAVLSEYGLARMDRAAGGGRPAEVWTACTR